MLKITEKENSRVLICCKVILVILIAFLACYLLKISGYQKVDAQIIAIHTEVYDSVGESRSSRANFVTYEYTYNDTNYRITQQIFTKIGKNKGDVVSLYCNPQDPEQVANILLIVVCSTGIAFLGIMLFLLSRQNTLRR